MNISVDYFSKVGSAVVLRKCTKACKAVGPPPKNDNLQPYERIKLGVN